MTQKKTNQCKFQHNDPVTFTLQDKKYKGSVFIIDECGTFERPDEVSYDILEESGILFKHIPESLCESFTIKINFPC